MYITAQRVRTRDGVEGINAFYYVHGSHVWEGLPPAGIPDRDPGTLMASDVVVQPPGNSVRSYLDVVAPDEASWREIHLAFVAVVTEAQRRPLPWDGVSGNTYFRVGVELSLATRWRSEIADLFRATGHLWLRAHGGARHPSLG